MEIYSKAYNELMNVSRVKKGFVIYKKIGEDIRWFSYVEWEEQASMRFPWIGWYAVRFLS